MNVERQFLEAMMQDPEDLDLRLVLADWYQEHDDPRGEFIQVQVALDRLPLGHRWRGDIEDREQELLSEHRKAWDAPLYRHLNTTRLKGQVHSRRGLVRGWGYRRGFVEHLSVDAATLMDSFDAFLPLGPLRSLRLWNVRSVLSRLCRFEGLSRFVKLDLRHNELGDAGLKMLLDSPHLGRVEELSLVDVGLTDQSVECLAAHANLPAFKKVLVSQNAFSFQGWEELLRQSRTAEVRHENGHRPLMKMPKRRDVIEPEFESYDDEILYEEGHIDTEGKCQVEGEWVEGYDAYDGFEEFDEDGLKYLGGYGDADQSDRWIRPNHEPEYDRTPWDEEDED
jgi:uncharacterized protein (TIGR02996 family)